MRMLLLLIASVSLLMVGCHTDRFTPSTAGSSELDARLDAAKAITMNADRDEALSTVARDAAKAGDVEVAKGALNAMTFSSAKDETTADCARQFASAGRSAAANEVARTITSTSVRDSALKQLATRAH